MQSADVFGPGLFLLPYSANNGLSAETLYQLCWPHSMRKDDDLASTSLPRQMTSPAMIIKCSVVTPALFHSSDEFPLRCLHLDLEQVAEANLGNVVCDVLVIHQVSVVDIGSAWWDRCIGLEEK
jgi:hypothetical protein